MVKNELTFTPCYIFRLWRVHFSACKTGLGQRQWACSGFGLDLGVDQSPSPPIGLASPFARFADKQACAYFSPPTNYRINLNDSTDCFKCLPWGLVFFPVVLFPNRIIHRRRRAQPRPLLSIHVRDTGLSLSIHSSGNAISPVNAGSRRDKCLRLLLANFLRALG
jgi:hypothetical protein